MVPNLNLILERLKHVVVGYDDLPVGVFNVNDDTPSYDRDDFINYLTRYGFSESDAVDFADRYRIEHQITHLYRQDAADAWHQEDHAMGDYRDDGFGFSGTLYFDRAFNRYIIAARGTEGDPGLPTAGASNDWAENIISVGAFGTAFRQIVEAYNWVERLMTPAGQPVRQISFNEQWLWTQLGIGDPDSDGTGFTELLARFQTGNIDWSDYDRDLVFPEQYITEDAEGHPFGLGIVPAGATIEVTGHSLGGNIASGLSYALQMIEDRYPGLYDETTPQVVFASAGFRQDVIPNELIAAIAGVESVDGYQQHSNTINVNHIGDPVHMGVNWFVTETGLGEAHLPEGTTEIVLPNDYAHLVHIHNSIMIFNTLQLVELFERIDTDNFNLNTFWQLHDAASDEYFQDGLSGWLEGRLNYAMAEPSDRLFALERTLLQLANVFGITDEELAGLVPGITVDDLQYPGVLHSLESRVSEVYTGNDNGEVLLDYADGSPVRLWARFYQEAVTEIRLRIGEGLTLETLLGQEASTLAQRAENDIAVAFALHHGMPFAVQGGVPGYEDFSINDFNADYYAERAEFLARLWQENTDGEVTPDGNQYWDLEYAQSAGVELSDGHEFGPVFDPNANNHIFGSEQRDVVISSDPGDQIFGGDDVFYGHGGNDYVSSGGGDDRLYGGEGIDRLFGGLDNDILNGGGGPDELYGGDGYDTYRFDSADAADGADQIVDSDGVGAIEVDGNTLGGGAYVGESPEGMHFSDGTYEYRYSGTDLHIYQGDIWLMQIRAFDFEAASNGGGFLGISLTGAPDDSDALNEIIGTEGDDNHTSIPGTGDNDEIHALGGDDVTNGGLGDDLIYGEGDDDELHGGAGFDELFGGGGNDVLAGWTGNDHLDGGNGEDLLIGGAGDDYLYAGPDVGLSPSENNQPHNILSGDLGNDRLIGGAGDDFLAGDGTYRPSTLALYQPVTVPWSFELINDHSSRYRQHYIYRTYAMSGTFYNEVGEAGDDWIEGGAGNDHITGGGGNDVGYGESGDDVLIGGHGDDYLDGGSGNDVVGGEWGDDLLFGGLGEDLLLGLEGNDLLDGGEDDDVLVGDLIDEEPSTAADMNDILIGGAGNDELLGVWGDDQLFGGVGNDLLRGGDGDDYLHGGDGADTLEGEAGADVLDGGAGNDELRLDGEDRGIFGLAGGFDTVQVEDGATIEINGVSLSEITMAWGIGRDLYLSWGDGEGLVIRDGLLTDLHFSIDGTFYSTETLLREMDGLTVRGNEADEAIHGSGGSDRLFAGGGDDVLDATAGNDFMHGGEGSDIYSFRFGDGFNVVSEEDRDQVADVDRIRFEHVNDVQALDIRRVNDDLQIAYSGDDAVTIRHQFLGGGIEEIELANRSVVALDTLLGDIAEVTTGVNGEVTAIGSTGDDDLSGGDQDDRLMGQAGDDVLFGGNGSDSLLGGEGNDVLVGDAGNDSLDGGGGADEYRFSLGDGHDVITETASEAGDSVVFDDSVSVSDVSVYRIADDLFLDVGSGADSVRLAGWFSGDVLSPVSVSFADGTTWDETALAGMATLPAEEVSLQGTSGDDVLEGGDEPNVIEGLDGNDQLFGGGGDDTIYDGRGDDYIVGGPGDDWIGYGYTSESGGNNTYHLGLGDGWDQISTWAPWWGVGIHSVLEFGEGIQPEDLTVSVGTQIRDNVEYFYFDDMQDVLVLQVDGDTGITIRNDYEAGYAGPLAGGSYSRYHWSSFEAGGFNVQTFRFFDGTELTLQEVLDMAEPGRVEFVEGSDGDDLLLGSGFGDRMYAFGGTDTIQAGAGDDTVYAFDSALGADTAGDIIAAGEGNDDIFVTGRETILFNRGDGADVLHIGTHDSEGGLRHYASQDAVPASEVSLSFGGGITPDQLGAYIDGAGNLVLFVEHTDDRITIQNHDVGDVTGVNADGLHRVQFVGADGVRVFDVAALLDGNQTLLEAATEQTPLYLFRDPGSSELPDTDVAPETLVYGDAGTLSGEGGAFDALGDDRIIAGTPLDDQFANVDDGDVIYAGAGDDSIDAQGGEIHTGAGNDTVTLSGSGNQAHIYNESGNDTISFSQDSSNWVIYAPLQLPAQSCYGNDSIGAGIPLCDSGSGVGASHTTNRSVNVNFNSASGGFRLGRGSLLLHDVVSGNQVHLGGFDAQDVHAFEGLGSVTFSDGVTLSYAEVIALGFDIDGSAFGERLDGTNVVDRMSGLGGDDQLFAGDGDDWLAGGRGNDALSGGEGLDTYRYELGDGYDVINEVLGQASVLALGTGIAADDLAFRYVDGGLRIDVPGGGVLLSGITEGDTAALDAWTISFDDGAAVQALGDELAATNRAPEAMDIADLSVQQGESIAYQLPENTFADPDGDALRFRVYGANGGVVPLWLAFDESTMTFVGTPPAGEAGSYELTIEAEDAHGAVAASSFTLTISEASGELPVIVGTDGDDILTGSGQSERLDGFAGNDQLKGDAGDDHLVGGAGNDFLDGQAGADLMEGGLGDDEYWVDSQSDQVVELANEGTDYVVSQMDYVLGDRVENLRLSEEGGPQALNATGNASSNWIWGNSADNGLFGLGGDDFLVAGAGDDFLVGGAGNDFLDGQSGADLMEGGIGDDEYWVDNPSDQVVELADEGTDYVVSQVDYVLGDHVENLRLSEEGGPQALNATGNASSNWIWGNSDDNGLFGLGGDDFLVAGAGDDILVGGEGNDLLDGGSGSDLYRYSLGDGMDTILESASATDLDVLRFEQGIASDALWFSRAGDDLRVHLLGSAGDRIDIRDWYADENVRLETLETSVGATLDQAGIEQLVSAMASFGVPDEMGEISLTPEEQSQLDSVIAAAWS